MLNKKMMKAMNLTDEQIEQIYEGHGETVAALKEEIESLKTELASAKDELKRLPDVEKELVKANAKAEDAEETAKKLKQLQGEFDAYKADIFAKEEKASKTKLYKKMLADAGIPEKRHDAIMRVTNLDEIKVDDGKISDEQEVLESIKKEWSDFIISESKQGANVTNPPTNTGGNSFEQMSLAEKMSYANDNPDSTEVKAWLNKQ